jgi:purine-cytosine permease-like protein
VIHIHVLETRMQTVSGRRMYARRWSSKSSIYGDVNWAAVITAVVGLVAGWAWEYGLVSFMQGPLAKATNNTDISWLAAFVVSGGLYYVLRPSLAKEPAVEAARAALRRLA